MMSCVLVLRMMFVGVEEMGSGWIDQGLGGRRGIKVQFSMYNRPKPMHSGSELLVRVIYFLRAPLYP